MARRPMSRLAQFTEYNHGSYPVAVYSKDGERHVFNGERNRWEDSPLRPPADYEVQSLAQRGEYNDEADY